MNLVRVHRTLPKLTKHSVRLYSQPALDTNEYTESPEYPPIVDLSLQARKFRKREAVREKIKQVNTVEEKQIALNMPRYYGWKCVMLSEDKIPYNALPAVQYYTRTHFIPMKNLPEIYTETVPAADLVVKETKSIIEDVILMEHEGIE